MYSTCCSCCLDCFHRFIKFLNENAYVQVALTGENFCNSGMTAFVLALKNSTTFFITNGIGTLIFFLGKMTISIFNTLIGYFIITNVPEFREEIENPVTVLAVVFLMSLVVANVFMEVLSSASLTILQCFYTDVDICEQSKTDIFNNKNRPVEMQEIVEMLVMDD